MKLRIKADSLRLRVSGSEVVRLLELGRVEEETHLGPQGNAVLVYALSQEDQDEAVKVRYQANQITVSVARPQARAWGEGESVGIYAALSMGDHCLELAIEKDFACLDRNDEENQDAFPNPRLGNDCPIGGTKNT